MKTNYFPWNKTVTFLGCAAKIDSFFISLEFNLTDNFYGTRTRGGKKVSFDDHESKFVKNIYIYISHHVSSINCYKERFDEIWINCIDLEENHFTPECIFSFLAPRSRTLISTPPHRLSLVAPIHPEKPRDSFLGPVNDSKTMGNAFF